MTEVIAITGATGFVGAHVAALLRERDFALRGLARDPAKLPAGVDPVPGGLDDPTALARLCEGASALVHAAGAIAAPSRKAFFAVNEEGTRALAAAARRAGISRFIHVSSLAAREPQLSDYAASKRAGEEAVLAEAGPVSLAILRPPAVYGPGDRATLPLFAQLTRRIAVLPGSRQARFSLLHASDLARFIASLLRSDWRGLAEVDDGQAGGYGWADLARIAGAEERRRVTPLFLPGPLVAGLARIAPPEGLTPGKARELYHPDWVCRGPQPPLSGRIGFAQGFRATLAWYREQGWLPPGRGADKRPPLGQGERAA